MLFRSNQPAPSAQPAVPALLQNPALQSDFTGLLSLIHDHDAMARDRLSEIRDAHPGLQGHPLVQQLQRALDRYDFDAAAQALEGLRQPLG